MTRAPARRDAPARINTEHLVLRRPEPGDLAAYAAVIGPEDAEREHRDAIAHWRAHGFGPWLVEEADRDGVPIGILEIHYAGPGIAGIEPHEVEVGWTIVEARRRYGYAAEAGRAAIHDAFARATNHHGWIVAYIRPENAVSQRVAARLGMRHEADGLTRSGDPMEIWRGRS